MSRFVWKNFVSSMVSPFDLLLIVLKFKSISLFVLSLVLFYVHVCAGGCLHFPRVLCNSGVVPYSQSSPSLLTWPCRCHLSPCQGEEVSPHPHSLFFLNSSVDLNLGVRCLVLFATFPSLTHQLPFYFSISLF